MQLIIHLIFARNGIAYIDIGITALYNTVIHERDREENT